MSGLQRFAVKQVAKHNRTLRLTRGSAHWHKRDEGRDRAGGFLGLSLVMLLRDLPPPKKPSLNMKSIWGKMVSFTRKCYFSAMNLTLRVRCI